MIAHVLVLRAAQVDALRSTRDHELAARAAAYLRDREPARCRRFADDELHAWIHAQLGRATSLGLHAPWDRVRFVRYELVYGPEFERTRPWARRALARARNGTAFMDRVEHLHRNYLAGRVASQA